MPLGIITATGRLTDAEYRAHLAEVTERLLLPEGFLALAWDGVLITEMPSSCRKLQADWINANRFAIKRKMRGIGFAFGSPFTRGLLTAVHWLSPPPYAHTVVSTRDESIRWCVDKLVRAGDLSDRAAEQLVRKSA